MKYLSVCSGIEAATVAWHHMGWEPVAFSEIEKFPSAVLAHHYPSVPNWGDMTKFKEWPDANVDVLVGGTPCQSFSVAGLRKGLDDPRGNLMLTYLAIAQRYRPEWLVWENVPGVLSSNGGRDFAALLRGLAELGYGWAYRVLDAQYFGVAQRRRRVFVVGYLGNWHRAAAVLFERHSLSGHPAPSRQARKGTAGGIEDGAGVRWWDGGDIAATLTTRSDDQRMPDKANAQLVMQPIGFHHNAQACQLPTAERDTSVSDALTCSQQAAIAFTTEQTPKCNDDCALTLTKQSPSGGGQPQCVAVAMRESGQGYWMQDEIAGTLRAEGEGRPSRPSHVIAFGVGEQPDIGHCLRSGASKADKHESTTYVAQPVPYDFYQITAPVNRQNRKPGDPCHTLARDNAAHAAIIQPYIGGVDYENNAHGMDEATGPLLKGSPTGGGRPLPAIATAMQVRRLTPVECSRLQGFPDTYLELTYGTQSEAHASQILHELWKTVGAYAREGWRPGIVASLLTPQILLAGVYGGWISWEMASGCANASRAISSQVNYEERFMLRLQEAGQDGRSPYQRESFRQLAAELGCSLPQLPLEEAQAREVLQCSELWQEAQRTWPLRYAFATEAQRRSGKLNADGPRYKALGNSMAVPVMRHIGERINEVSKL